MSNPEPAALARPMTEADLPAVLDIERRAYRYPWSPGNFHDCLRAGYGCFVDLAAPVRGYTVVRCAAAEAHVLNLCVDPRARRQGIASDLVRVAVERAEVLGAEALFLEVRPSNAPALALYERHGFHEVGRRPGYYPAPGGREEAVIMARAV